VTRESKMLFARMKAFRRLRTQKAYQDKSRRAINIKFMKTGVLRRTRSHASRNGAASSS